MDNLERLRRRTRTQKVVKAWLEKEMMTIDATGVALPASRLLLLGFFSGLGLSKHAPELATQIHEAWVLPDSDTAARVAHRWSQVAARITDAIAGDD